MLFGRNKGDEKQLRPVKKQETFLLPTSEQCFIPNLVTLDSHQA